MRPRLKTALTFTAGLLVGATAMGAVGKIAIDKFQAFHELAIARDIALHLQMLSSEKRTDQLRELLFSGLPQWALRVNAKREDLDHAEILWSMKLAYSMNDRPVPRELETVFANLPAAAAPICPTPRKRLGLPPITDPSQPGT